MTEQPPKSQSIKPLRINPPTLQEPNTGIQPSNQDYFSNVTTTTQARKKVDRSQFDSVDFKNTSITNNSSLHDPLLMNSKQIDDLMTI